MKRLVSLALVSVGYCALAVEFLPMPGSQKGAIVFVNAQQRLPESEIQAVCSIVEKATKCKAVIGTKNASPVTIEIVDDENTPVLTAYPEDYKAKVNISKLAEGLSGKALNKFFASRCRKELLRAFCFACGAGGSQYPNNIMAIGKIADLDLCDEFIPGDTAYTCADRLLKIGITQKKYVPYAKAVRDGWAPAPTNDVQRAIWEKVHQIPDKPITIKYDPKKDK